MALSNIEWCDYTFNPWIGCTKVSPACDNCYAENFNQRFNMGANWGAGKPRYITSIAYWKQPLRWNRQAEIKLNAWKNFKLEHPNLTDEQLIEQGFIKPERPRVFCASLADVFDNEVQDRRRIELFALIRKTPHLDWLLLTKRIGNADTMIAQALSALPIDEQCGTGQWNHTPTAQWPWPNVWIGATICNQEEADRDIPKLLKTPAAKRFVSIEPMLGGIELEAGWLEPSCGVCFATEAQNSLRRPRASDPETHYLCDGGCDCEAYENSLINKPIDWVICGGESGKDARPMHPVWVRSLRDQCYQKDVPFLFKQWGEWVPRSNCYHTFSDGRSCSDIDPSCTKWPNVIRLTESGTDGRMIKNSDSGDAAFMQRVGKKTAGRLLDGKIYNEYPQEVKNDRT